MTKRGKIVAGVLAFLVIGGIANANNNPASTNKLTDSPTSASTTAETESKNVLQAQEIKSEPAPAATPTPSPTPSPAPTPAPSSGLSNDNHYTNSAGNEVHSPAYSSSVPAGATARCGDGTYSFSQSRRGTCSHHGGVASWL